MDHMSLSGEIENTECLISAPLSVFLQKSDSAERLSDYYWSNREDLDQSLKLQSACLPEFIQPINSINARCWMDVECMVAQWRRKLSTQAANMSDTERYALLAKIGLPDIGDIVEQALDPFSLPLDADGSDEIRRLRHDSSASSSILSPSSASHRSVYKRARGRPSRKRGSHAVPRQQRVDTHARSFNRDGYWHGDSGHRTRYDDVERGDADVAKSRYFDAEGSEGDKEAVVLQDDEEEDDEEEEEEEEDLLTTIVQRQRQAFTARVAAGRPSVRDTNASGGPRNPITGRSGVRLTKASSKVIRAWKSLIKKDLCKVARQRTMIRRDKIAVAKRAARECARFLRQRALVSQKATKEAPARGHRLVREIATHWRNSAASIAAGTGPLIINGITMPSLTPSQSNWMFQVHQELLGVSIGPDGTVSDHQPVLVESAAAARRRAERAAAEQRRADLELLEARRQQRKLNFLITQTELYAHFIAKKMDDGGSISAVSGGETSDMGLIYDKSIQISPSVVVQEPLGDIVETTEETARILRRLEDTDEEEEEEALEQAQHMDVENCEVRAVPIDQQKPEGELPSETEIKESKPLAVETVESFQLESASAVGASKTATKCSSIAAAAKAAANRLGMRIEDEYDVEHMKVKALSRVKSAVEQEKREKAQFLGPSLLDPKNTTLRPISFTGTHCPELFKGQLKAYQLSGLNWLLGLFDQGINGILADEMGLGKTIQTIAFFGCLAETYGIWGPFLIVTPASTLHNWTQEFARFLPAFRLVPYWGSPTERKVLRRFWPSRVQLSRTDDISSASGQSGTKGAEMHVVITSYQVVMQDAAFINKTAWSYIVLDEAHAIKSTASMRWRILLSFKCRNRLLLTGTPIQNTMQELWALLHFIMPSLFDSHDEFANWFSRDIESQVTGTAGSGAGTGGLSSTGSLITAKLNENQLSRLHLILKPFMLRRTKAEVEHEISEKTEIMRYCPLSHRQQLLYNRLRTKICLEDLSSVIGSQDEGTFGIVGGAPATARLINLVMQLRKVCNHPDLWEARDVRFACVSGALNDTSPLITGSSYAFGETRGSISLISRRSSAAAPWHLPVLFYDEGLIPGMCWNHCRRSTQTVPNSYRGVLWFSGAMQSVAYCPTVCHLFDLFHPFYVHADLWHGENVEPDSRPRFGKSETVQATSPFKCFSFSRLLGLSPHDLSMGAHSNGLWFLQPALQSKAELSLLWDDWHNADLSDSSSELNNLGELRVHQIVTRPPMLLAATFPTSPLRMDSGSVCLIHSLLQMHLWINEPGFSSLKQPLFSSSYPGISELAQTSECISPYLPSLITSIAFSKVLLPPLTLNTSRPFFLLDQNKLINVPVHPSGLEFTSLQLTKSCVNGLELVSAATRITDSAKLTALDALLTELKPAGHRVLIYSQMTRMIDILEEFMLYRKHAYLRLDGSSRLCDRRDMVAQWQDDPRLFCFLLSTRAGGLGINLTAADTVIFYDSDWNPTVDQQAMDRAHRLGQTKPVTVYRLICKNTVEGRMLRRAEEKRAMQQMVIQSDQQSGGSLLPSDTVSTATDQLTSSEMVSLLLDDDELIKRLQIRRRMQPTRGRPIQKSSVKRHSVTKVSFNDNPPLDFATPESCHSNPTAVVESLQKREAASLENVLEGSMEMLPTKEQHSSK